MTAMLLRIWRQLPDWLRGTLMMVVNPRFVITASAVVLNERGEVLLFKHTYRASEPWGLPGGFLKSDEDPNAAIEREVMEESGLDVCAERPLWVGRYSYFRTINVTYAARLRGGVFRPSAEVCEARYFSFENLPVLSPGAIRVIAMARAAQEDQGLRRSD